MTAIPVRVVPRDLLVPEVAPLEVQDPVAGLAPAQAEERTTCQPWTTPVMEPS